jgi:hypothetical protein
VIISNEKKYIFIHIPKNAGTSIEIALTGNEQWRAEEKHLTARECIKLHGEQIWQDYFTFCIVRNPWDRLVSQFNFSGKNWCIRYFGKPLNFSEYVTQIVDKGLPFSKHDYLSKTGDQAGDGNWQQLPRISNDGGEIIVDFVGRFENLKTDFDFICDKLNLSAAKLKLPQINKSSSGKKPYWTYYNDETANIIATVFADDIDQFDYTFGQ